MVDIGKAIERAADTPSEAAEAFREARSEKRAQEKKRQQRQRRQTIIRGIAWLGAIAVGLGGAFGYLNTIVSPWAAGIGFAAFVGLAWALGENDDEVSITFALSTIAIGVLAAEFVAPAWVVDPIAEWLLGWGPAGWFAGWSAVEFAVLSFAMIALWWFIDIRFISRSGVKPETVAKRFGKRLEGMIGQYLSVVRVAIMAGFAVGFFILQQLGMITGDLMGYAGEAPYLAADLATILLGYLALGGDVPFFNGIPFLEAIGTGGWLALTGIVLVLAVGVDYAD
jgi:hypothetical protein